MEDENWLKDVMDRGFSSTRASLCDVLRSLIINNIEHFHCDKSSLGTKIEETFIRFLEIMKEFEVRMREAGRIAHLYDLDADRPGNGYRSIISVGDSCLTLSIQTCRTIHTKRDSFIFRKQNCYEELKVCVDIMFNINQILEYALMIHSNMEESGDSQISLDFIELLYQKADEIDSSCFYGSCIGFQYCESMRKPLEMVTVMMAAFGDGFYNTGGMIGRATSSLIGWGRYVYYPAERSKRIMELTKKASVDFCRSFWLLNENHFIQQLSSITVTSVPVNKILYLPPEPIVYVCQDSKTIEVPVPSSHIPPAPVTCRLLSSCVREGQFDADVSKPPTAVMPPSPFLIIHCHGGGFVAQSSKSHEVYLHDWARHLDVPLFSIDYSLAPKAPYPRSFEECFFAYVWALENCHKLGSTGEKICLVGDSAGGVLIMSITLKAIELGIRLPDGLLPIYTPLEVALKISPSRMLCVADPLLPLGIVIRCFAAYLGGSNRPEDHLIDSKGEYCNAEITSLASKSDSGIDSDKSSPERPDYFPTQEVVNNTQEVVAANLLDEESRNCTTPFISQPNATVQLSYDNNCETFEEVSAADFRNLEVLAADNESSSSVVNAAKNKCANGVLNIEDNKGLDLNEWCVLDVDNNGSCTMFRSESAESEENILFEIPRDISQKISDKVTNTTDKVLKGISNILPFKRKKQKEKPPKKVDGEKKGIKNIFAGNVLGDAGDMKSAIKDCRRLVKDDYYVSPLLAPDALIERLPPVHFVSCVLDPCLDDAILFSKRLLRLHKKVGFDLLEGLPHGFLNFALVSKDAADGSKLCIQRLRQLLDITVTTLQEADLSNENLR